MMNVIETIIPTIGIFFFYSASLWWRQTSYILWKK